MGDAGTAVAVQAETLTDPVVDAMLCDEEIAYVDDDAALPDAAPSETAPASKTCAMVDAREPSPEQGGHFAPGQQLCGEAIEDNKPGTCAPGSGAAQENAGRDGQEAQPEVECPHPEQEPATLLRQGSQQAVKLMGHAEQRMLQLLRQTTFQHQLASRAH
eukprot:jgi/Tetstr1/454888/TSEL_041752.t1